MRENSSLLNPEIQRDRLSITLARIPVNLNGLALGLSGLGLAWKAGDDLLFRSPTLRGCSDMVAMFMLNASGSLILMYLCKLFASPKASFEELNSADSIASLCTMDMAVMSIALLLRMHGVTEVSFLLWSCGCFLHYLLLLYFIYRVSVVEGYSWSKYRPSWMIPPIGICIAAGTGYEVGVGTSADLFFYQGLLAFAFLFPAAVFRAHFCGLPEEEVNEPQYAILAAPSALLLCNWITIGGGSQDWLTHILFMVEIFAVCLVFAKVQVFARLSFTVHQASFTFPADITAKAMIMYTLVVLPQNFFTVSLSFVLLGFASSVVLVVSLRFLTAALDEIRDKSPLTPVA